MNFWWRSRTSPPRITARHQFVIGPRPTGTGAASGRLYYCARCNWSFLVCGSRVAVLDENGIPIAGAVGRERFATFENGPCPMLAEPPPIAASSAGAAPTLDSRHACPPRPPRSRRARVVPILGAAGRTNPASLTVLLPALGFRRPPD
jgi:hypothetical protein